MRRNNKEQFPTIIIVNIEDKTKRKYEDENF